MPQHPYQSQEAKLAEPTPLCLYYRQTLAESIGPAAGHLFPGEGKPWR